MLVRKYGPNPNVIGVPYSLASSNGLGSIGCCGGIGAIDTTTILLGAAAVFFLWPMFTRTKRFF